MNKNYKKVIDNYSKGLKRIIKGITLVAIGLILPEYLGKMTFTLAIDNIFYEATGSIITPIIMVFLVGLGTVYTVIGTVKSIINKSRMRIYEKEEDTAIKDCNARINELIKENNKLKNEKRFSKNAYCNEINIPKENTMVYPEVMENVEFFEPVEEYQYIKK